MKSTSYNYAFTVLTDSIERISFISHSQHHNALQKREIVSLQCLKLTIFRGHPKLYF